MRYNMKIVLVGHMKEKCQLIICFQSSPRTYLFPHFSLTNMESDGK